MSASFYNEELYPLQDDILTEVGKVKTPFYLTGGTAISRFMLQHRYSDDLDFFLNRHPDFQRHVDVLVNTARQCGEVAISFRGEDILRVMVTRGTVSLKLEFVNDVAYRVDVPQKHAKGFLLDTWENILAYKITALSRQAAKDAVDIAFIALHHRFNWEEAINHARQKDAWIAEHEVARLLLDFRIEKLNEVTFTPSGTASVLTAATFQQLARDAFNGFNNSLGLPS